MSRSLVKPRKASSSKVTSQSSLTNPRKPKAKKSKGIPERDKWKLVPPKEGESKVKNVKGKKFHWCKWHNMWTVHDPEDTGPNGCHKRKEIEAKSNGSAAKDNESDTPNYKKAFASILQALEENE